MKKTKEITIDLTQQIDGSYKPNNYLDFGTDALPVHLTALVTVELPEEHIKITESQLRNAISVTRSRGYGSNEESMVFLLSYLDFPE